MFANACVGYKNFRYFYALLIYVFVGTLYSTYLNMYYVWDVLGGFTTSNFFGKFYKVPGGSKLKHSTQIFRSLDCYWNQSLGTFSNE